MRRRTAVWLVPALVALAVAGAGCSGDDDGAGSSDVAASGTATPGGSPDAGTGGNPTAAPSPGSPPLSGADPVPAVERTTLPPVGLDAVADYPSGVSASVSGTRGVSVTGRGPGEVSGPALEVDVDFSNGSGESVSLDAVTVSLAYGDMEAPGFEGAPASPASGDLSPGGRSSGVYVFSVPEDSRQDVTISVSYAAEQPVAIFAGDASS